MFDRLRGLRQAGRDVDRPDVYSVLPGLEGDIHARAQRVVADAGGIIVEDLLLADLDEQRRQPVQVGEDRRAAVVGRVGVPEVVGSHGLQQRARDVGVEVAALLDGGPAEGEVGERGDHRDAGGQGKSAIAGSDSHGQREVAACGIAQHG